MNREQFEHSIRAAGAVLGVTDLLVIGSQALHASLSGNLPDEASRSVEVDVAVFEDTNSRGADLIDGSIGEASMFHSTFGYYVHGVAETTAMLPQGWRDRLVRRTTTRFPSVVNAWCGSRLPLRAAWWPGASSRTISGYRKPLRAATRISNSVAPCSGSASWRATTCPCVLPASAKSMNACGPSCKPASTGLVDEASCFLNSGPSPEVVFIQRGEQRTILRQSVNQQLTKAASP